MDKQNAVVIGGGLGGLSAAISLAKENYSVTVIEKNNHLGGKLNQSQKKGFTFDLGPSILTMPHIFEHLFAMHGKTMADYVNIKPVRPHWRNIFEDKTILDLHETLKKTVKKNKSLSENDLQELQAFYRYAEKKYRFAKKVLFDHQSERKRDTLKHYNPLKIIPDSDMFNTMNDGVKKYINNPHMQDTLNFFIKYVGASPFEAPAVMNLLPYIQWEFDLWHVEGGMFNLSKALEKLAREVGVHFMLNSEVKSITKSAAGIDGLNLSDGSTIGTDVVVSNMEAIPFYEKISKEAESLIQPYRDTYPPSASGFAMHLGVDRTYDVLAHHTIFHAESSKAHFDALFHSNLLSNDPSIYVVAPMKSDSTLGPKDHEIIKVLPHVPSLSKERDFSQADYDAFRETVLDKLERMGLNDLRKHIVTEETWTPHTIKDAYYSNGGSIYGTLAHKEKNMGFKVPKQSKFYKNLFFVGDATNPGGGMPMVVLSGQQVAKQIKRRHK